MSRDGVPQIQEPFGYTRAVLALLAGLVVYTALNLASLVVYVALTAADGARRAWRAVVGR